MADTKRQGTASNASTSATTDGRVATPKISPTSQAPGADLGGTLAKAVGARIQVNTSNNKSLEGILFAADPSTNLVALNTSATSALTPSKVITQSGDFHLIHTSHIQSFKVIAPSETPASNGASSSGAAELVIPRVDVNAVRAKEDAAVHRAVVGPEGCAIYDLLSRSLPTRWHETSIVVSDAVIVEKPYKPENCSAPEEKQSALAYVKRVLEAGAARNNASASRNGTPAPPQGRKGG